MAAKKRAAKKPRSARAKKAAAVKKRSPRRAAEVADVIDDKVAQIQRVIAAMKSAGAVEVEIEDGRGKLRIRLQEDRPAVTIAAPAAAGVRAPDPIHAEAGSAPPEGDVVKSPMVGTFYRAPAPDADPFVRLGEHVATDTTLCIIEAMKVMNEIKADFEGEIVEILVENGEPVDFGQPLFVIRS